MRSAKALLIGAALAMLCVNTEVEAQTENAPAAPSAQAEEPTWTGLPFSGLSDFERLIPIGMMRSDLVRALGEPEAITPGREIDQAYHYAFATADGRVLRAVVIVRADAVFIRRLYISSPSGVTARAN